MVLRVAVLAACVAGAAGCAGTGAGMRTARSEVAAAPGGPAASEWATGERAVDERAAAVRVARAKQALFGYRGSDVVAVRRVLLQSGTRIAAERITLEIDDPLRRIGRFEQTFLYHRHRGAGARPTVLVFPLFGTTLIDGLAVRRFCRAGFNALLVLPAESLTEPGRPLAQLGEVLVRYAIVARIAVDMLEGFPETDRGRIFAYGTSMGGIRTALVFGVEPRIRRAGVVVAGGDLPGIIADTRYRVLEQARDHRMAVEGIADLRDLRAYLDGVLEVDPLDVACLREPEDVMLVVSSGDRYIRDIYQEKLCRAFARPAEGRYPAVIRSRVGHLATGARFGRHVDRLAAFFGEG